MELASSELLRRQLLCAVARQPRRRLARCGATARRRLPLHVRLVLVELSLAPLLLATCYLLRTASCFLLTKPAARTRCACHWCFPRLPKSARGVPASRATHARATHARLASPPHQHRLGGRGGDSLSGGSTPRPSRGGIQPSWAGSLSGRSSPRPGGGIGSVRWGGGSLSGAATRATSPLDTPPRTSPRPGGAIASLNAQLVGHGFAALTPRPSTRADADARGYSGHGDSASYDRRPLMAGYLPSSSSGMPHWEEEEGSYPAEAVRAEAAEVRVAAQEVRAWLGLGLGLGVQAL